MLNPEEMQNPYAQQYYPSGMKKQNDQFLSEWLMTSIDNQIQNIANQWRGGFEDASGNWSFDDKYRIMNEKGIRWCIGFLKSNLGSVFQSSNFDENNFNFMMLNAGISIWVGLVYQYREFEMEKVNVQTVGTSMQNLLHSAYLAPRGEGLRKFLSSTHNVSEIHQSNPNEKKGFFSNLTSALSRGGSDE